MPAPEQDVDGPDGPVVPGILARRIDDLIKVTLRPVSDADHARAVAEAGDPSLPRAMRPILYTEIAQAIGRTPTYVADLRKGKKNNPTWKVLQQLADVFGVSVGALVNPQANLNEGATLAERVNSLFKPIEPTDSTASDSDAGIVYFTPEEVAEKIGADPAQLCALRAGTLSVDEVPVSLLQKLAAFFGIPVSYLIDGSGNPEVEQTLKLMQDLNGSGVLESALRRASEVEDPESRAGLAEALAGVIETFVAMERRTRNGSASGRPGSSA